MGGSPCPRPHPVFAPYQVLVLYSHQHLTDKWWPGGLWRKGFCASVRSLQVASLKGLVARRHFLRKFPLEKELRLHP